MKLVVMKFGGSSVATADLIRRAAGRAIRAKLAGNHVAVVVSARGDTTDDLIGGLSKAPAICLVNKDVSTIGEEPGDEFRLVFDNVPVPVLTLP